MSHQLVIPGAFLWRVHMPHLSSSELRTRGISDLLIALVDLVNRPLIAHICLSLTLPSQDYTLKHNTEWLSIVSGYTLDLMQ